MSVALVAPERGLPELRALLARRPQLLRRIEVVAPGALRAALAQRAEPLLIDQAVSGLAGLLPAQSARSVATAGQGVLAGAGLVGLPAALALAPGATLLLLHVVFSLFFLACVGLRALALTHAEPLRVRPLQAFSAADMPVYSVLVALYREAELVPDLLLALGRLAWPRGKLDIKLVCEADDHETLAAIRAHGVRPCVEVVEVPAGGPRTKPKALAYALPLARGELLALYDAEDRPHPLQLIEAWQAFRAGDERLACVQAPLDIGNGGGGFIARMFAFEYAAHFHGLLPWLARHGLFIPLGGTSNHFRRAALAAVGGWDPYNVTEDADLGLRLARCGYRTGLIARPTLEDAPEAFLPWLRQRTRWFKGWLQTWLVHMRRPRLLWRELGPGGFLAAQLLLFGMLASVLAHPLFLAGLAWTLGRLLAGGRAGGEASLILLVDSINIPLGYLTFVLLGRRGAAGRHAGGLAAACARTAVYFVMLSLAACRALWQLCRNPHHWEKTPHTRHFNRTEPAA